MLINEDVEQVRDSAACVNIVLPNVGIALEICVGRIQLSVVDGVESMVDPLSSYISFGCMRFHLLVVLLIMMFSSVVSMDLRMKCYFLLKTSHLV